MATKVSVVIPTYDNFQICKDCLDSIEKNTDFGKLEVEVIVVANGCKADTEDMVRSRGAPFRLLSFPDPIGYVKATNLGIVASRGEYVLLLNDDCYVLEGGKDNAWLHMLMHPMERDKDVAVTGSNRAAWTPTRYFMVFFCAMTRRRLLVKLGLLNEEFGLGYGEDLDYCMKIQDMGLKLVQVPVEYDHYQSQFPIWHRGKMTFCRFPQAGNNDLLEKKYPRTEADREFTRKFLSP